MKRTGTVIIGGGQAGLALSHCLTQRGREHVVLERGRIGERWRSERWDSLRLLTPRWQARLPGWTYDGPEPEGYMTSGELVDYLEAYASSFDAPIHTGVDVRAVERACSTFRIVTNTDTWDADSVVVATGDAQHACVPDFAPRLADDIEQVLPTTYRRPADLQDGGVLVVGASATGIQLAAEIHASGRPVHLSVGRHTRLPRRYRGRDILVWLDEMGLLDQRIQDVRDPDASRAQPSLQLIGSPDGATLDLRTVQRAGVRLLGRATDASGSVVNLGDNLVEDTAAADFKLASVLRRIDAYIRSAASASDLAPAPPFETTDVDDGPQSIDLHTLGIRTVVWATGFRRSYPWLRLPVLDTRGEIVHTGGVTPIPGLYAMGLRFMRRRNSSFIDGQRQDAEEIADQIDRHRSALHAAA
ncbi:MAG: NAD(P)/FAD-dependent oxidoreductase [Gemmatimonadota bacterium]